MSQREMWRSYGRFGTVGLELVLSIVVGYWIGKKIDGAMHWSIPWATVLGTIVGLYSGFRSLLRASRLATKEALDADEKEKADRDDYLRAYRSEDAETKGATNEVSGTQSPKTSDVEALRDERSKGENE